MDEESTHFAADVIFRAIFSRPMDQETAQDIFRSFEVFQDIGYAHGFLRLVRFPTGILPGARRGTRAARRIRAHLKRLLDERVATVARGEAAPQADILASLMTAVDPVAGDRFDETELLDQIATMFLAGHETSASTLAWAVYMLASCPHLQDRVLAESVAVYGDRTPVFGDMKKLAFTRDVVRETLRLYPPVAFVARDAEKDEKLGRRQIPAGSVVFVPLWLVHRHKQHWAEPDAFDPDRFQDEATKEAQKCAYLPFSMGPRVCPGASFALQETTLYLSWLVRRFRFKTAPGHTPEPVSRLTLRSANGIRLIVEPR